MLLILLDGLIAGLLVITIVLAIILNRRFANLRRDRLEFSKLAAEFHTAVARAEDSVGRLKTTAAHLENENRGAERHADDLLQLIERADAAADRLEAAVRGARSKPAAAIRNAGAPQATGQGAGDLSEAGLAAHQLVRSSAEDDLLQALRFKR